MVCLVTCLSAALGSMGCFQYMALGCKAVLMAKVCDKAVNRAYEEGISPWKV